MGQGRSFGINELGDQRSRDVSYFLYAASPGSITVWARFPHTGSGAEPIQFLSSSHIKSKLYSHGSHTLYN